jgi:hypothetical protein
MSYLRHRSISISFTLKANFLKFANALPNTTWRAGRD